jgi:hypothetical protein
MSANVEAMVREGSSALKAGRKEEARALLMKAVELDQYHEDAWLWLSAVVETAEDQQTCLENVLAINPSNERARQGMQYLQQQRTGGTPAVQTPAPPPLAPAKAAHDISSSVEWSTPDNEPPSATSSSRKALDLSKDDYDNWVGTLNLPNTGPKPPGETSPFFDNDEEPAFDLPKSGKSFPVKSPPPPSKPKQSTPQEDDVLDLDFDESPPKQRAAPPPPEPYEPLFPEIPDEIRATRLPGTRERLSIPLLIALVLLLAFNIVAGIQLFQSVFGA